MENQPNSAADTLGQLDVANSQGGPSSTNNAPQHHDQAALGQLDLASGQSGPSGTNNAAQDHYQAALGQLDLASSESGPSGTNNAPQHPDQAGVPPESGGPPAATTTPQAHTHSRDPLEILDNLSLRVYRLDNALDKMGEILDAIIPLLGMGSELAADTALRRDMEAYQHRYQNLVLDSANFGISLCVYARRKRRGKKRRLLPRRTEREIEEMFDRHRDAMTRLRSHLTQVGRMCDEAFGFHDHQQLLDYDIAGTGNPFRQIRATLTEEEPELSIDDRVWNVARRAGIVIEKI